MTNLPPLFFDQGEYLLEDSAFGTSIPFIVTPYKRPASSLPANARFNARLSRARIIIEHCVGILKVRFPLSSLLGDEKAAIRFCKTQRACVILHNICVELNEAPLDGDGECNIDSDSDDDDDHVQLNCEELFSW
ncbi:TPA: hypothetical protein N0F65_003311 [Lagenidium giganteum]|uniref:DDE Tnp4 domain-containing protein n=1 Tax=Lagenidium giganteum TaxID=4803 RepID=A0AAV2ZC61_9STRA|nr:TPA: hypothetical protein N0F65_003311 [Lagenidium giganteum]